MKYADQTNGSDKDKNRVQYEMDHIKRIKNDYSKVLFFLYKTIA